MISQARIIDRPPSGEYQERIFDHPSPWRSDLWSYVEFLGEAGGSWCGVFRGEAIAVTLSEKSDRLLVLSSDFIFHLDRNSEVILDVEVNEGFEAMAVSSQGGFLLADPFGIEIRDEHAKLKKLLEAPFRMHQFNFCSAHGANIPLTGIDFYNRKRVFLLEIDTEVGTLSITQN